MRKYPLFALWFALLFIVHACTTPLPEDEDDEDMLDDGTNSSSGFYRYELHQAPSLEEVEIKSNPWDSKTIFLSEVVLVEYKDKPEVLLRGNTKTGYQVFLDNQMHLWPDPRLRLYISKDVLSNPTQEIEIQDLYFSKKYLRSSDKQVFLFSNRTRNNKDWYKKSVYLCMEPLTALSEVASTPGLENPAEAGSEVSLEELNALEGENPVSEETTEGNEESKNPEEYESLLLSRITQPHNRFSGYYDYQIEDNFAQEDVSPWKLTRDFYPQVLEYEDLYHWNQEQAESGCPPEIRGFKDLPLNQLILVKIRKNQIDEIDSLGILIRTNELAEAETLRKEWKEKGMTISRIKEIYETKVDKASEENPSESDKKEGSPS